MAVTRIKNNQITDSTITYQKIATGTLVGSLFNANLTLNSNISIAGNLTVTGNTTTVSSIDTLVSDSLITLNNGYVGVPAYDVGILFNRALGSLQNYGGVNAALVWSESDGAFIAVLTTETGTTAGTINRAFQANMIVGNLTVSNTVTAQTATITTLNATNTNLSGLTSTGNIVAASGQNATNYTTGALVVPGGGGVGITGDLWVQGPSTFAGNIIAGNIQLSGNINVPVGGTFSNTGVFFGNAGGIGALYAGTSTYTALPTTVLQMSGNVDTYAQVNFQNINAGTKASTDFVLTADNGNDTDGYIDLGINSSTYNDPNFPGLYPNDGYLIHHSALSTGNLVIFSHTDGSAIKLHVGDYGDANVKVTITNNGLRVNTSTTSTSTTSGALLVDGGLGVAGNIHAAAINATPIGNTTPSTGAFTTLSASNISFTTLFATNFSTGNAVISGGYISALTNASIIDATITNLNSTAGNVTTLVATNFSSGNARITGGYADNFQIGANTPAGGNFTTANATSITGYNATIATVNATTANIITGNINTINTSVGNITTGNINTLNTTTGNITNLSSTTAEVGTANVVTVNSTSANLTTVVATNLSTGNARITGGYADNFPIGANTPATGNFTTANAGTVSAYTVNPTTVNATNGNITTLVATNFSSGNARITGGNIVMATPGAPGSPGTFVTADHLESYYIKTGNLEVESFANIYSGYFNGNIISANSIISGGNITATQIGIGGAAAAEFTDLTANGNVAFISSQQSGSVSSGALVVTGGVGIGANLNVGGNLTVTGNLSVLGDITQLSVSVLNVEDKNIVLAFGAPSAAAADGAGITVEGANASITYVNLLDSWQLNKNLYGFDTTMVTANVTTANLTTANVGTLNVTNVPSLNVTTLNVSNGNITTLVSSNFSSANARITGGYADSFVIGPNIATTAFFTTANADIFDGNTVRADFYQYANGQPFISTTIANTAEITANISGGQNIGLELTTTGVVAGNYGNTTAIPTIVVDSKGRITSLTTNTLVTTYSLVADSGTGSLNTGNSLVVNGTVAEIETSVSGNAFTIGLPNSVGISTLVATNFSTANARVTGGYADNFPIGANTAAPGYFTNLEASNSTKTAILNVTSNVYLSPQSAPATVTMNPLNGGTVDSVAIGSVNAANVYATGLRAATSFWAATTGPVWIRGGTGTSGINNIPIGAVTPSTGAFTVADIATGNITTLNNFTGNITTLVATNLSSGNVVISGGYISALTNAYVTTGLITNFSTANARITGGYADNFPIGANTAAPGSFTTLSAASINNTIIGNATPAAGTFTNLTATANLTLGTGNIVISSGNTTVYTAAAGTANTTGALVITGTGGAAINGNVYIGQGAVINGNRTTHDTIVRGVNERSLVYVAADSTYDQVSIGGNITTANITQGAKLAIKSTDSMLLPVGTTAQRPGAVGFTDVDGMIRYNTTTGELEYYGGGQWNNTGSTFTIIESRTFSNASGDINGNVDGSNTQFTLASNASTASTLVSINGVVQIPTTAYSVSGNVVIFTEAPAVGDVIDTRIITTSTSITSIASADGYNQYVADANGLRFYTGNVSLGSVENWRIDTHGDLFPVTTANLGYPDKRIDYIFASNINIQGGTITGAGLSQGSLDDTIIGANIAKNGHFTTLFANETFTTNAEHVTDDVRGKYVAPSATDAVYGFPTATYRSGKFFVQLSSASEYQAAEVIAVHNGTTCSIEVYGVTFTGAANLATFSCNIAGGTAYLNASSAGANLAIKVTPTLMKI